MAKMVGTDDLGMWVSLRYIERYGRQTDIMKHFRGKMVAIQTDKGLWRPDASGYTMNPAHAGLYPYNEAIEHIWGLGPEKHAKLRLLEKKTFLVEYSGTVEIEAYTAAEAAESADLLLGPLNYPPGAQFRGKPMREQ